MNKIHEGKALYTTVEEEGYPTMYVMVASFQDGFIHCVKEDGGRVLVPVPYVCWDVIDRLKQELSGVNCFDSTEYVEE